MQAASHAIPTPSPVSRPLRLASRQPRRSLRPTAASWGPALPSSATPSVLPRHRLRRLSDEFRSLPTPLDRLKRLLGYAALLPPLPESERVPGNRVPGCAAQVWVSSALDDDSGCMRFGADSDSEIARGFCACLVAALDGSRPEEVVTGVDAEDLDGVDVVGLPARVNSRANPWRSVLISMQRRAEAVIAKRERMAPADAGDSAELVPEGSARKVRGSLN